MTEHVISERAPAKINLSLHITGRRADGYHLLDSVFVPLELSDELSVRIDDAAPTSSVSARCPDHAELDGDDNLAARAARAYLEHVADGVAVDVTIKKRIWLAAGLGGGSSDAAAVLRALQRVLGAVEPETLARIALGIGADVPFFVDPRAVRVRGIGEQLEPLPPAALPTLELLLLNPGVGLSTAEVYRGVGLAPGAQRREAGHGEALALDGSLEAVGRLVHNDLQPSALALCGDISTMISALEDAGARAAAMSGSGATVFGLFDSADAAAAAESQISQKHSYFRVLTRSLRALTPVS